MEPKVLLILSEGPVTFVYCTIKTISNVILHRGINFESH